MTRKKKLWLILPIQLFAALFVILFFVGRAMHDAGYELLVSGRLILGFAPDWCMMAAIALEMLMLVMLAVVYRKNRAALVCFIILCVFGLFLFGFFGFSAAWGDHGGDVVVYHYDEFEQDIVIESWSFLLGGFSNIYETQNGFLLHHVGNVLGDDGYRPLEDPTKFQVTVSENGILYEYQESPYSKRRLLLKYQDGHFVAEQSERIP